MLDPHTRGGLGVGRALSASAGSGCSPAAVAQTGGMRCSSILVPVGALLTGVVLISGCAAQPTSVEASSATESSLRLEPAVDHVHGAVMHDGVLLLGTHSGLVEVDLNTGETRRRGSAQDDLMGLASNGAQLIASGHPGAGSELPDPLGLIRSQDAGSTWQPVSLTGQVDFHGLAADSSLIAGIGTADGVLISQDGGATWSATGITDALSLAWFQGALWIATDGGLLTWRAGVIGRASNTAQSAIALTVDSSGSALWAVAPDGSVMRTTDGSTWERRGSVNELEALAATADTAYAITSSRVTFIGND
jgi:hypothetical protein